MGRVYTKPKGCAKAVNLFPSQNCIFGCTNELSPHLSELIPFTSVPTGAMQTFLLSQFYLQQPFVRQPQCEA